MVDIESAYRAAIDDWWASDDEGELVDALVSLQAVAEGDDLPHWQLYLEARIAQTKGDLAQALDAYQVLLDRFGQAVETPVVILVAMALGSKGVVLEKMGRVEEAVAVYDDVVARLGDAREAPLRKQVARALGSKGIALRQLRRLEEAVAVHDDVVARFGDAREAPLRGEVARALLGKGISLGKLGRSEEALAVCDDVVARFGDAKEGPLSGMVAKALVNKGVELWRCGRREDEIAVYHDVIARFGDAKEAPLREQVAKALVYEGITLAQLDRTDEAVAAYDDAAARFGDAKGSIIKQLVARALANKGTILRRQGNDPAAQEGLTQAREISSEITDKAALEGYIRDLADEVASFKRSIQERADRTGDFLSEVSNFPDSPDDKLEAHLFFLREWNSFTPIIPDEAENDRGGGYFIRYGTHGIVVDPGHDFIEQFCMARGRLVDIDHIILSHAHTDHTAEVEAIFTLLYEYNVGREPGTEKKVSLYISQDAYTKFSGLLGLWAKNISRTKVLNPALGTTYFQTVSICDGVSLTVLPAEHEDQITQGKAVGLGLEFKFGARKKRRIIFTCDTGYLRNAEPISQEYPEDFREPDLLVAHLGSIHPNEFELVEAQKAGGTLGDYRESLYPNHLGLFGTCLMIRSLAPACAVISEFGEELKDIRIQLVTAVGQVVQDVCPVLCGDPTMVYRISDGKFLCHQTCEFEGIADLAIETHRAADGPHKPYLVKKGRHLAGDVQDWCEKYHERLKECYLPYFATGAWPGVT